MYCKSGAGRHLYFVCTEYGVLGLSWVRLVVCSGGKKGRERREGAWGNGLLKELDCFFFAFGVGSSFFVILSWWCMSNMTWKESSSFMCKINIKSIIVKVVLIGLLPFFLFSIFLFE